jgi:hypothetical protein
MNPTALTAHLERLGYANTDGIHRAAHMTRCPHCRASRMSGLNAETAAMPAHCDPTPLNALGELQAVLASHYTCTLTWNGQRYELDHRDEHRMRSHPPGPGQYDVLAQHVCAIQPPPDAVIDTSLNIPTTKEEFPNECPF